MAGDVRTVVVDDLTGYESQWDALVDRAHASPFLRSWWLEAIRIPSTQFVLVLAERDALIGGASFETITRDRRPVLCLAGSALAPDHLDILAADARVAGDRIDQVVAQVRSWLAAQPVTAMDFEGVREQTLLAAAVPDRVRRSPFSVAPWMPLPASFDDYWQARPSALRNTVERTERRLAREGATYEVVAPEQADRALEDYLRLHEHRFGERSAVLPVVDRFRAAALAGLECGELVAHRYATDGHAIAIDLWFEVGGVASFYQAGRDPDHRWRGAGSVLKARAIERACARGDREIDFLRGAERYKQDWADDVRTLYRLATPAPPIVRVARRVRRVTGRIRRAITGRSTTQH